MPKQIRVSDEVYQELLRMQRPRETFSQIIARLLRLSELLIKALPLIKGEHESLEHKIAQSDPFREDTLERRDFEARTLDHPALY